MSLKDKEARAAYIAEWQRNNREKCRANHRRYWQKNKLKLRPIENSKAKRWRQKFKEQVINIYGGRCECCGETEMVFLTIDHMNNDGAEHRRSIGGGGKMYAWLRSQGYPREGYRVLCMNCQFGYRFNKVCPHQKLDLLSLVEEESHAA